MDYSNHLSTRLPVTQVRPFSRDRSPTLHISSVSTAGPLRLFRRRKNAFVVINVSMQNQHTK